MSSSLLGRFKDRFSNSSSNALQHVSTNQQQQDEGQSQSQSQGSGSNGNHTIDLMHSTFTHFYSLEHRQFEAPAKSEGTLGEADHFGYTVWSVIITVHALADAVLAGDAPANLHTTIQVLEEYWNVNHHGFCAWKFFPGNKDIYYDDNAHAAQALISAFEATNEQRYIQRAHEIVTRLLMPAFASCQGQGVPWHISDHTSRNACSTGPAAVAALRLCKHRNDDALASFAEAALHWIWNALQDPDDKLIMDNIKYPAGGEPQIERMKWTYNTGFAIHGSTLLYERTKNPAYLEKAKELAIAAMNKLGPLYDRDALPEGRASERMYADGSFFLHHLMDGFFALQNHALQQELRKEIMHTAQFGRQFMFDSLDGLCFRGSRPYEISEGSTQAFNERYGVGSKFQQAAHERDDNGRLIKTLIGCSGWARVEFVAARIG